MGWMKKMIARIAGTAPTHLTFVPEIAAPGVPGVGETLDADGCYVELYLESLRLEKARSFATQFDAVCYSFVSLAREGESRSQLTAVSKPDKLAQLDAGAAGRVITVSKQMMGLTPYRGGVISLEFGLFAVKRGNFLSPVLDYVTKVSAAAGLRYVGAIRPFVPLIVEGMDLIAGQTADCALEVGLDTDLRLTSSCVMAIIDCPKGAFDLAKLTLDSDRRLLLEGRALECGYAVFSLRRAAQKDDFGEIPELKERYAAVLAAMLADKESDARAAMTAFRLAAITSPDLITLDAKRLVEKVRAKFDAAFPPGGRASTRASTRQAETLADIQLY